MEYRPHEHFPLLLFGLLATPLSIGQLLGLNSVFSIGIASILAMIAGLTAVFGIVKYWHVRYS
jgi:hypothetical protein